MPARQHDRLLGALGLCRKAGRLAAGHDAVLQAIQSSKAALVLVAKDTAPNTVKKMRAACPVRAIPYSQNALARITQKPVGVLAVCDIHLAALCLRYLPGRKDEEEPV